MYKGPQKLEGAIQRIGVATIIKNGIDFDPDEVRKMAYHALYRHVEDKFMSIAAVAPPFDEQSQCKGCEVEDTPHTHFDSYFDIDVDLLKRDLDKFYNYILAPFIMDD